MHRTLVTASWYYSKKESTEFDSDGSCFNIFAIKSGATNIDNILWEIESTELVPLEVSLLKSSSEWEGCDQIDCSYHPSLNIDRSHGEQMETPQNSILRCALSTPNRYSTREQSAR
ncbi:hypothetical protein EG68_04824 [Paragonimus skrjabini miyazakii]|uniref:Uncharacterized protein n=1 Tax=Paragonimus skrjabini miyazakii TaxID=59628 RepID=A0A8S9YQN8_9TREM|nr:hypothetical protein EG68_04824 [Paragonimus skrjabini miyazakii]